MNVLSVPDNLTPVSYEQFMSARSIKSPAQVTWPPTLVIELALKTATPEALRLEYGYSPEAWAKLPQNPVFMRELMDACEMVRQEGMSFKLKAKIIAEENLTTVWKMIHAPGNDVPPNVKADLIKKVADWAGFDPRTNGENNASGAVAANTLNIQINLGQDY